MSPLAIVPPGLPEPVRELIGALFGAIVDLIRAGEDDAAQEDAAERAIAELARVRARRRFAAPPADGG